MSELFDMFRSSLQHFVGSFVTFSKRLPGWGHSSFGSDHFSLHSDSSKKVLRFKKLSPNATKPTRASRFSAGYDLYSARDMIVPSKNKSLVPTDLQVQIPSNCYGRVAPRSGLAHKNFIDVGAGVIDADYRGNVGVILFNFGDDDFVIKKGDRIAQLICEMIEYPELEEVESLDETERGSGGFGSTGK